jgi:hypothetical protein
VPGTPIDVAGDDAGNLIVATASGTLQKITSTITLLGAPASLGGTLVGIDVNDAGNLVAANTAGTVFVRNILSLAAICSTSTGGALKDIATNLTGDVIAVGGTNLPSAIISSSAVTTNNFGTVLLGATPPARSFSVTKSGDPIPVTINSITPHAGCINCGAYTIAPTGAFTVPGTIIVTLKTSGAGVTAGNKDATFDINATATGGTVNSLTFSVLANLIQPTPNPECTGGACATILAEADYTIAGAHADFTKIIHNAGTLAAQITSMTISSDPNNEYVIVSGGGAGSIPSLGNRSVVIRYTPIAGEHTSPAFLTVNFDNTLGGPSFINCCINARAHHPEPNMVVSAVPHGGATVNYRDVEIGFTFTKAIKVSNIGDAPLNLDLNLVDPADPDLMQWSEINEPNGIIIAAGAEQIFLQRFKPLAVGSYTFEITALGTGGGGTYNSTSNVTLTGNGISPVPMDNVLVMDRSGSMADAAGSRTKIDALQKAARLYYDLLRTDPGDGSGDQIGMVKYNSSAQNYFTPLQLKSPAIEPTVLDLLSEAAITDAAKLQPNGGTCISCGMTDGANLLLASPDTRKQIMIVMTDGIQTAGPNVTDAFLTTMEAANPDMLIYSLGLGNDIDGALLGRITNAGTQGYHQVSEDLLGIRHFALEEFYFKIYANASGADLVVDPTFAINLSGGNAVEVDRAHIVSSDRSAMFMMLDDPALASYYTLEFIDPHGTVLDPTSSVGGIPIQILQRAGHTIYKIIFPDISQANNYVGDWVLRLNPTGKWKPGGGVQTHDIKIHGNYQVPGEWIHPYQGVVPIGFGAAVKSDYNMQVSVAANNYQPGAEVLLSATLSDRGWPSVGGHIEIVATRPNNSDNNFLLYDDGTHSDANANDGVYSNRYNNTALEGNYRFFFDGRGINDRGELVPRQATRYVSLFAPGTDGGNGPDDCKNCFPCWLYYVMLLLLLIILWLIIRCCRRMKVQAAG